MTTFKTPLRVELLETRKDWKLISDFEVYHSKFGEIVVPTGFVTDFASVPRILPISYAAFGAYGHSAAVVHDWLYRNRIVSRKDADDIFYDFLRESGIARWRAKLMWAGVRIAGWAHY